MKLAALLTVSATALGLVAIAPAADAKEIFVQRIPNGSKVPGIKAIGHTDGTGASDNENAFGKAFDKAGQKWTTALCQADTDGDGQTNGQELGDPCCEWTQGSTPRYTTASHPSDNSKTNDASLWASINCTTTPTATTGSATSLATATATLALAVAATLAAL